MPRQFVVPIAALFLAGLALAAGLADARQSIEIVVGDSYFEPSFRDIPAGATITWRNEGALPHTVTSEDGSFNSGIASDDWLRTGDTFSFTFTQGGSFAYYCAIHGGAGGFGQSGTIIVGQEPQTPPPTPPPTAPPPPVTPPPVDPGTPPPTPTPTPLPTPSGAPGPAQPTQLPTPTPVVSPSPSPTGTRRPTATSTEAATGLVEETDESGGSSALPIVLGIVAIGAVIAAVSAGFVAWKRRQEAGPANE